MEPTAQKAVTCPILVGRQPYLDVVTSRLRMAEEGRGGVLLLSGEAGIGKSRLVHAAMALAEAKSFLILRGACYETGRSLPFVPIVELLRNFS